MKRAKSYGFAIGMNVNSFFSIQDTSWLAIKHGKKNVTSHMTCTLLFGQRIKFEFIFMNYC